MEINFVIKTNYEADYLKLKSKITFFNVINKYTLSLRSAGCKSKLKIRIRSVLI